MKEQGVLEDFLKNHKYDPGQKYRFDKFGDYSVLYEPMSYMDVSLNTLPLTQRVSVPAAKGSPVCLPALGCTHPSPNLLWATVREPGGGDRTGCFLSLQLSPQRALWLSGVCID